MIALRARAVRRTVRAQPINERGEPLGPFEDIEVLDFEGLEDRFDLVQTRPLVEDEEQIVFAPDDAVPEDDPRRLRPGDVPRRNDLPESHACYGKRLLAVVPAGWPNCTVDARGRLVPVDEKGQPIEVAGAPV